MSDDTFQRLGVTDRQLQVAAAQWRLQRYGRSDTVSAEMVQPGSLTPDERRLDALDSPECQRARAEQVAAEFDGEPPDA